MALDLVFEDFSCRDLELSDARMILDWRNRDHVREGMFHSRRLTIEEHLPWVESRLARTDCSYFIFEYLEQPISFFGVYDIDEEQKVGEWVYYSAPRPPELPRGTGAAGEFIALDTFFGVRGLRRLWGRTMEINSRVWAMHQRFGFEIEGRLREHLLKDGQLIDILCVGLLRREWIERRKQIYPEIFRSGALPELPPKRPSAAA